MYWLLLQSLLPLLEASSPWTYNEGGDDWEGECKDGKNQSPIVLDMDIVEDIPDEAHLHLKYNPLLA